FRRHPGWGHRSAANGCHAISRPASSAGTARAAREHPAAPPGLRTCATPALMDLCEVPTTGFVRHPWERARLDFFHGLLRDHVELGAVRRILDVGSGDGWLARQLLERLPAHASMTCFDVA